MGEGRYDMICSVCNRSHLPSAACVQDPLGFDPVRCAEGERQAEAGKVQSLEAVMAALRDKVRQQHEDALAAARAEGARQERERIRGRQLDLTMSAVLFSCVHEIGRNQHDRVSTDAAWSALLAAITEGE